MLLLVMMTHGDYGQQLMVILLCQVKDILVGYLIYIFIHMDHIFG